MFIISSAVQSYALFLQDAILTNNEWYIGFVLIRFYFLWHKNDTIASGVRQWCQRLSCSDAQKLLLQLTANASDKNVTAATPEDWFVSNNSVEDHIVPTQADISTVKRDENVDSFVKQLFYAEWIDLCQCIYWNSDTQNNLLVGVFRDE
jgi:hypothetical protein